jgi:hypothetical protein
MYSLQGIWEPAALKDGPKLLDRAPAVCGGGGYEAVLQHPPRRGPSAPAWGAPRL